MPTKKISDLPQSARCLSPDHNPPNMMVYQPGTYEHTCSRCGHITIFTVSAVTCQVPDGSRSYIYDGPDYPMTLGRVSSGWRSHDMWASMEAWG